MKILVCYPMKSLVHSFLPNGCEALAAEYDEEFFRLASIYQPEAVVVFSEMFTTPPWEWIPSVRACLDERVAVLIAPICKDEPLIHTVIEQARFPNTYVLPAAATHEELRSRIGMILGIAATQQEPILQGTGLVYALLSYGASGITTFCINYPILLAKRNPDKRIAVIDMNGEKPDLTRFFRLHQHQLALYRPDLLDKASAVKRNWAAVFKQSSGVENLYYANGTIKWKSNELYNLIEALRQQFDYVYLDWGYCFPETEALHRLLLSADRNLFFVRADPFSVESAKAWITRWLGQGIQHEVLVSHFDKGNSHRIGEGLSVYGVVPRISENRLIQSHRSHSALVEEFFPPKQYINSLQEIADADKRKRGAVIYG